jgi:cardiolipin synthase
LGLAIFTLTEKPYEINPTLASKCTTTIQLVMILLSLFDPDHTKVAILHPILVWGTAAFTIVSGLHYIYIGMNILQEPNDNKNGNEI